MEINEKKNELNHNAELVDDVNEYIATNIDKIEKASSDVVKTFIKK